MMPAQHLLMLADVSHTYTGREPVVALRGCSIDVKPTEYVVVTGVSGSGKSTLLNVLGLLTVPTDGRYLVDGTDTSALEDGERTRLRRTFFGFLFQAHLLIPWKTAAENVESGLLYLGRSRRRQREEARQILEDVGLTPRANALAGTLSGGESQRVALARALVSSPRVLLCDEPTGSLDKATGMAMLDLIDRLRSERDMTIVMITHDERIVERGSRHCVLEDGLIGEVQ